MNERGFGALGRKTSKTISNLTHAHPCELAGMVCKTFMRRFDSDPRLQLSQ